MNEVTNLYTVQICCNCGMPKPCYRLFPQLTSGKFNEIRTDECILNRAVKAHFTNDSSCQMFYRPLPKTELP